MKIYKIIPRKNTHIVKNKHVCIYMFSEKWKLKLIFKWCSLCEQSAKLAFWEFFNVFKLMFQVENTARGTWLSFKNVWWFSSVFRSNDFRCYSEWWLVFIWSVFNFWSFFGPNRWYENLCSRSQKSHLLSCYQEIIHPQTEPKEFLRQWYKEYAQSQRISPIFKN